MEYKLSKDMKKYLQKQFLEKHKGWLIGTGIFVLVGVVLLFVGFSLSGWDFITWIKSPYAVTFFILLGIGIFLAFIVYILWKKYKIGGYNNVGKD